MINNLSMPSKISNAREIRNDLKILCNHISGFLNAKTQAVFNFNDINKDNSVRLFKKITFAINKYIRPQIDIDMKIFDLGDFDMIKLYLNDFSDVPYSSDGRYFIYNNNQLLELSPSELIKLINKENYKETFENKITSFTIEDLDKTTIDLLFKNNDFISFFKEKNLLKNDNLTASSYYLFGDHNLLSLNYENFIDGSKQFYNGNIINILNHLLVIFNYLDNDIFKNFLFTLLLNFNYKYYFYLNLNIYEDKIEITLDSANEINANNIKNLTMFDVLKTFYNDMDFISLSDFKKAMSSMNINYSISIKDNRLSFVMFNKENKELDNKDNNKKIEKNTNRVKDKFLDILIRNPYITNNEIASILDISTKTVQRKIKELKEKDIIQREGNYRTGYWKIDLDKLE